MKTIFAITALARLTGPAIADWEDVFKNPDLDPKFGSGFDREFPPVQPSASQTTSLDDYYRGNADVYSGESTPDAVGTANIATTSLDVFTSHNPDQYDGIALERDTAGNRPYRNTHGIGDSPRSF